MNAQQVLAEAQGLYDSGTNTDEIGCLATVTNGMDVYISEAGEVIVEDRVVGTFEGEIVVNYKRVFELHDSGALAGVNIKERKTGVSHDAANAKMATENILISYEAWESFIWMMQDRRRP